jgi:hypothetical protein
VCRDILPFFFVSVGKDNLPTGVSEPPPGHTSRGAPAFRRSRNLAVQVAETVSSLSVGSMVTRKKAKSWVYSFENLTDQELTKIVSDGEVRVSVLGRVFGLSHDVRHPGGTPSVKGVGQSYNPH